MQRHFYTDSTVFASRLFPSLSTGNEDQWATEVKKLPYNHLSPLDADVTALVSGSHDGGSCISS